MKKKLLVLGSTLLLLAFKPNPTGFPDLRPDSDPTNSYAVQAGNFVSCYTKAILDASPLNGNNPFKVGFFLSTDTAITPNDILIGYNTITSISLFSPITCSVVNVDLSTKSVPTGTYYIGTYVDYENTVPENGFAQEIPNNNWSFKNASGVYQVVSYPGKDVGIATYEIAHDVEKQITANGDLIIRSKREEDILVEVYSINGQLLQKEKSQAVTVTRKNSELLLLKITTSKGSASEKIVL